MKFNGDNFIGELCNGGISLDDMNVKLRGFRNPLDFLLRSSKKCLNFTDYKLYVDLEQRCSIKRRIYFCFPNYITIMEQIGLQSNQITISKKKLEKLGLITTIKIFKSSAIRKYSNLYFINDLLSFLSDNQLKNYINTMAKFFNFNTSVMEIFDSVRLGIGKLNKLKLELKKQQSKFKLNLNEQRGTDVKLTANRSNENE